MGVHDFTKVFEPKYTAKTLEEIIKMAGLVGRRVSVDAMLELNKAYRGVKANLTNKDGEATHYIGAIISIILKLQRLGVHQEWQLDFDRSSVSDLSAHLAFKSDELAKRKEARDKAQAKLDKINAASATVLELSSDPEMAALMKEMGVLTSVEGEVKINDAERIKLERIAHNIGSTEIKNLKTIMDYLGVRWLEAPETYEGEHIGAIRTWEFDMPDGKHCDQYVDCVITNDADALLYGARAVIKRSGFGKTTTFMYYEINDLLTRYSLNYVEFIQVCLCLGTDALPAGVKGIGKKTVLEKFRRVDYTPYIPIIQMYGRRMDTSSIVVHNKDQPFLTDPQKEALLRWLVDHHGFNEERQRKILFKP
jgi:5'-3' exonuclease